MHQAKVVAKPFFAKANAAKKASLGCTSTDALCIKNTGRILSSNTEVRSIQHSRMQGRLSSSTSGTTTNTVVPGARGSVSRSTSKSKSNDASNMTTSKAAICRMRTSKRITSKIKTTTVQRPSTARRVSHSRPTRFMPG